MGARGAGHLRYLCEIAPPRIGVVVNVGVAHIGEFGSVEAIAAAKGELVEALPRGRRWPCSTPTTRGCGRWPPAPRRAVVLVGEAADADVRADDVTLDERGRAAYTPGHAGRAARRCGSACPGRHQVGNTLRRRGGGAASWACRWPSSRAALGELRLVSTRRMDVFDRADGVTVIDDSYNANPASMAAALRALAAIGAGRRHGRRARLPGRARRRTSGPGTRRSAGSPPSSASTG